MSGERTILLIRHAETDMAGTFCGHSDPAVNARGLAQIEALLGEMKMCRFDAVYTSDLQRARTTAGALADRFHVLLRVDAGLREIHFGEWESKGWEEIERDDPEYARRWAAEFPALPAPRGEEFVAFQERVLRAFDAVVVEDIDAAVVAHAGALRVMLTQRCGLSDEEAWQQTKQYCGVFVHATMGVHS